MTTDQTPAPSRAPLTRRGLLRLALASAGTVAAGPALSRTGLFGQSGVTIQQGTVAGVISGTSGIAPPKVRKFDRELTVPPVIGPVETRTETVLGEEALVSYYDVEQRVGYAQLLPPPFPPTQVWGYNGIYPGPTFRQVQGGAYTVVRNTNRLPGATPSSTHLHGSPTQPSHDGHPDDETWPDGTEPPGPSAYDGGPRYCPTHVYRYPNHQGTRTLWYHDHAMHQTADNVYKGLVGMFLQDPSPQQVTRFGLDALPQGRYDVPLVVADMQFRADGSVAFDDGGHDSLWGNVVLVNGTAWPKMTVDRTRYRLRVLVADLSRGYSFSLTGGDQGSPAPVVTMIGTDAGLLTTPVVLSQWRQGMAERYEVVVDFSGLKPGEKVTLRNTAADGDLSQVMQFVAGGPVVDSRPVPPRLNDYVFGEEEAQAVNLANPRRFRFERSGGQWAINGLPWDGRVAATPKVGTVEKWILENKSGGWFHPVHIHLVDFHIVKRNGKAPFAYEKGWKDVVYVGPNETVELVMRFNPADRVDPAKPVTGKYVMHCHNLVHEDHDMMTQFETRPGGGTTLAAADAPSMMVQWDLQA